MLPVDAREHSPETVWQAQELYCSDRLTFAKIAEILGVADSTLRRWADKYGWREKREEIAKAEADIRADKVLARSKTIKALLDNPRADTAFAVSALENLTLKEAEAARERAFHASRENTPILSIKTHADAIAALRKAVEQKLAALLTRPESVDLKAIQEVQKCLVLIGDMEKAQPQDTEVKSSKGLSEDVYGTIMSVLTGKGA